MPVPLIALFCVSDTSKKKEISPPLVTQDQVKLICDTLINSPNYNDKLTGTLSAFLNDVGCRYSEAIGLTHENFRFEEGYWLVELQDSKTKTRTNIIILSKDYLKNWISSCPTRNNKKGFVFCNKLGLTPNHNTLRKSLKKTLGKLNINWKKNSAVHYFRHLAASRYYEVPENLLRNYLGWSDKSMRSVYSTYNWKNILPYLIKANKGNPMLDKSLNYFEEEIKSQEEIMKETIRAAVRLELAKSKS